MADGGEGTLETFAMRFPSARRFTVEVNFHEKQNRQATWLLLDDGTAITELADACGLTHMKVLDPLNASTFAFGQVLKSAAENPRSKENNCVHRRISKYRWRSRCVDSSRCTFSKRIWKFDSARRRWITRDSLS
jgi:hypothetical protein